jgi:hypothetical protein
MPEAANEGVEGATTNGMAADSANMRQSNIFTGRDFWLYRYRLRQRNVFLLFCISDCSILYVLGEVGKKLSSRCHRDPVGQRFPHVPLFCCCILSPVPSLRREGFNVLPKGLHPFDLPQKPYFESFWMTGKASTILMAYPMPSTPAVESLRLAIPTTSPARLVTGPPLLPGLIAASVSIRLV